MKNSNLFNLFFFALSFVFLLTSCTKDLDTLEPIEQFKNAEVRQSDWLDWDYEDEDDQNRNASNTQDEFGIFYVIDEETVEMEGEISSSTLADFNELLAAYPNIARIEIIECGGSSNDEINLKVSKKVHDSGIHTHLLDDGMIASGGVDFFLAGVKRTIGQHTQIGVHSWSDGQREAKDFPVDHRNHQPYIQYYLSIGFTKKQAEQFYYFTINAAPAESMHWMTENEIEQYNMLN